jgi:hypothetical protein
MIHAQSVPSYPSTEEIEERFNRVWPNLQSRAAAMSRRYAPDAEEAEAEALASMSANFVTAARKGRWLPPSMLAHYAAIRLRSGRTLVGNCVNDPLGALCRIRNGSTAHSMSNMLAASRFRSESSAMRNRLIDALTSNTRENPAERCATKLDWESFVQTQPTRIQRVLTGLAEGHARSDMAKAINVSASRLTQIMDRVKLDVFEFFGECTPDFILPIAA